MADLIAHQLRLLGNLGAERRFIVARLVGDDGERCLQSMSEIADLRACPIDNILIGLDQRVEFGLQRLDFGRQLPLEAFGFARANTCEAALDAAQRQKAEPHLEHRDAQQPEADKRQRRRQARAESWRSVSSNQSSGPATMIEYFVFAGS